MRLSHRLSFRRRILIYHPLLRIEGTAEDVDRFSRRTVRVTREHNEECRKLLKLMGIPVVVVRLESCFYLGM